jgi:hypothetical protein
MFAGRALKAAVRCKQMKFASSIMDAVESHPSTLPYPYLVFSRELCKDNRQKGALVI